MTGVRTELAFEEASACPLADASAGLDGPLSDVTWSDDGDGSVTEQFTASGDVGSFEAVFDYGHQQVYEFDRDADDPCICEHIQSELGPLRSVYARDGNLHVTLHTSDLETLRDLLADLRERFGTVSLEYLVQSRTDSEEATLVPVDVRQLTDRQREVLETAYGMGYFEYPRDANATEVAETLDIEPSTFAEHLSAAQSKLLDEILGGPA